MHGSHTWAVMHTVVADYRLIKPVGALMLSKTLRTKAILFAFIRKTAALEMHTSCNCFNDSGGVRNEFKKNWEGVYEKQFCSDRLYIQWPPMLADAKCFFSPCLAFFSSFLCQCTSLCCLWSPLKHCELFVRPVVNGISPPPQFVALIIGSLTLRQVHLWARQCASVNRFLNAKILLATTTADNFLMHS